MNTVEKSTQLLREEHQLIESATAAIADIIKELEKGAAFDRRRVWEMAQLFATYVSRSHHAKEDCVASLIRARRGSSAEYPVRTFYEEHHRLDVLLASVQKRVNQYLGAAHGSSVALAESLRAVVDFYRGHVWKADHILFPLAEELLSETDQEVLVQQFAWIESTVGGDAGEQLRANIAEFHPKPRAA